jgi:hypothetical protein
MGGEDMMQTQNRVPTGVLVHRMRVLSDHPNTVDDMPTRKECVANLVAYLARHTVTSR